MLSDTNPLIDGTGTGLAPLAAFFVYFSALQDFGQPVLKSLRTLELDPRFYRLRKEINAICAEIEAGAVLSEACEQAGGQLSRSLVLEVLKSAEAEGNLEIALQRLANCGLV